jgi:hypothetical protein
MGLHSHCFMCLCTHTYKDSHRSIVASTNAVEIVREHSCRTHSKYSLESSAIYFCVCCPDNVNSLADSVRTSSSLPRIVTALCSEAQSFLTAITCYITVRVVVDSSSIGTTLAFWLQTLDIVTIAHIRIAFLKWSFYLSAKSLSRHAERLVVLDKRIFYCIWNYITMSFVFLPALQPAETVACPVDQCFSTAGPRPAARYWALALIIPGRENLSF